MAKIKSKGELVLPPQKIGGKLVKGLTKTSLKKTEIKRVPTVTLTAIDLSKKLPSPNTITSKNITLFDVYRKQASIAFNYPTVKMCADGDVCTYLRSIVL